MQIAKTSQLADKLHLVRRANQLKIDKKRIDNVQQYLYKLQEKYAQASRDYDQDLRNHWEKYGKIKKIKNSSPPTSTSLKKALDDLGMSAKELLELVS